MLFEFFKVNIKFEMSWIYEVGLCIYYVFDLGFIIGFEG